MNEGDWLDRNRLFNALADWIGPHGWRIVLVCAIFGVTLIVAWGLLATWLLA